MSKFKNKFEETRGIIRDYIQGGMAKKNLKPKDMAAIAHITERTWYSRMKQPETFTLKELIPVLIKLDISIKIYRKDEDLTC